MLIAEAKWLARGMHELPADKIFPLLNVGSNTAEFRTKVQPWIDRRIFAPARARGLAVTHLDIKPDPGVDLVGDLADAEFLRRLAGMHFASVLCSNLLEHVTNREEIGAALASVISPGGYFFVSCPYRFPYHPDPIDTLFRPDVAELAAVFPGTEIVRGEIVDCGTWWPYLARDFVCDPFRIMRTGLRKVFGRRGTPAEGTQPTAADRPESLVPWLFKKMSATCLILRKSGG